MIKKILIIAFCLCLICTLFFALRGKDVIFTTSTLLDILEGSPQVSTEWILSIDNAKSLDGVIRFPRYKLTFKQEVPGQGTLITIFPQIIENGFITLQVPFITSLWNILIDSVKALCYVATTLVQVLVYVTYFLGYLFA